MYVLIGDIGNTVTKICLIENRSFKVKKIVYFSSHKILLKNFLYRNLKKIIKKKPINKFALFSSVVPKYHKILKKLLKKNYKIQLKEIKENGINKIIKINIKNKKQVGSDRIANSVGVFRKYKTNCIVLDFGTATTFDVVTKKGIYIGGVIAPGITISIKSLSISADQIPTFYIQKQKRVIGKNTIEALRSGFYWGYLGLINNIITKIEKESKKKYKIIFTGGFADLFKTSITRPFKIDKNITINGIIEILKMNRKYLN
ncbi:MAG: type III pantothenate kinase [Candidatus Pelagibacterales bacterium]|nr:MAG: type III pantothenate kinase [Pelagibacterales bacterium]